MIKKKTKPETNEFPGNQLILRFKTLKNKGTLLFEMKPEAPRLSKHEIDILFKYECQKLGIKNAELIEMTYGDIIKSSRKKHGGFGSNIKYFISKDVPPSAFGIKRKKRIRRK